MMKQIKYSYCQDENNDLVHISSVSAENRHTHTYRCLQCGQEMTPKLSKNKEGSHKSHFAHAADTACDGESYLHKLAKRRIREKFMSADSFPIELNYKGWFIKGIQQKTRRDLKSWKGNVVYDTCQEEVRFGEFQPDLLLSGPMDDKLGPVFIEVYKTHKSEESKVNSGYRIIETRKIKTESDIDDIIEKGFIEGHNCRTFNFRLKLDPLDK